MWQVVIYTHDQQAQMIGNFLEKCSLLSFSMLNGGEDVLIEQNINEQPLWSYVKIEVLIEHHAEAESIKNQLLLLDNHLQIQIEKIEEKNWLIYSLKDFKPMSFGDKLWVFPHWLVPENIPQPSIILDPGFAFGTGQHETTKMCLEWLASNDIENQTVIDYGCGSGILGLAAIKLGARQAFGMDIDPQAIEASVQNAILNQIHLEQFITTDAPQNLPEKADVIIANIVMNALLALRDYFAKTLTAQGRLVLSGLLKTQVPQIIAYYAQHFVLEENYQNNDWGCLCFSLKMDKALHD